MALSIANPNASIFTSDPLEQIYAKGTLDRDMSGLAGLLLYSERARRASSEDKYLGSLSESNKMTSRLMQMKEMMDQQNAREKLAVELVKDAHTPSSLKGLENIIGDYKAADANALLQQDLTRALAEKARMARSGGSGGAGTKDEIRWEVIPWNGQLVPRIVTKGGSPEDMAKRGTATYNAIKNNNPGNNPSGWTTRQKEEYLRQLNSGGRGTYPGMDTSE